MIALLAMSSPCVGSAKWFPIDTAILVLQHVRKDSSLGGRVPGRKRPHAPDRSNAWRRHIAAAHDGSHLLSGPRSRSVPLSPRLPQPPQQLPERRPVSLSRPPRWVALPAAARLPSALPRLGALPGGARGEIRQRSVGPQRRGRGVRGGAHGLGGSLRVQGGEAVGDVEVGGVGGRAA